MQGENKKYEAEILETIFYEADKMKITVTKGYAGTARMDIRAYYFNKKTNEWAPTKRGVNIGSDIVKNIAELFDRYYDEWTDARNQLDIKPKKPRKPKDEKKEEKKEENGDKELKLNES